MVARLYFHTSLLRISKTGQEERELEKKRLMNKMVGQMEAARHPTRLKRFLPKSVHTILPQL